MRKVTEAVVAAFLRGHQATIANTSTDGQVLRLHGNAIARKTERGLELTLAGWNTPTTRERLNGVLAMARPGLSRIGNKARVPYLGSREIPTNEWFLV